MRNLIPIFAVALMLSSSAEASRPGIPYRLRGPVALDSPDRNALFFYGRELCTKSEYALALEYFKRAVAIQDRVDDDALVGEAQCLWHLKRESEALAIFTDVQRRVPLCDFASLTKAMVLMESEKYDAALEACDFLADHSVDGPEQACLLRSRIYEKQNQIVKAQEQAQCAYYHCKHLGQPTTAAEARLKELDCVPTYSVNTRMNDTVFSTIDKLTDSKPDLSRKNFERIFGRSFEEISEPYRRYYYSSIRREQLFQNVQLRGTLERVDKWIWVVVNPDLTSITADELEGKYGHDCEKSITTTDQSTVCNQILQYSRPFGSVQFFFAPNGSKCLTSVMVDRTN